ncbi:hypothetical protein BDF22DRAFT_667636 [Syncephalis plumigaleata]|nr:hypothetical protein BDF22DRAFT_667636 [Syncephalis plumigaleata]
MVHAVALVLLLVMWPYLTSFQFCCLAQPSVAYLSLSWKSTTYHYPILDSYHKTPLPYNVNGLPVPVTFKEDHCSFRDLSINASQYSILNDDNGNTNSIVLIINKADAEIANCSPLTKLEDALMEFTDIAKSMGYPKIAAVLLILNNNERPLFSLNPKLGPIALLPMIYSREVENHIQSTAQTIELTLSQPANQTVIEPHIALDIIYWSLMLTINIAIVLPAVINLFVIIYQRKFIIGLRNLIFSLGLIASLLMLMAQVSSKEPFASSVIDKYTSQAIVGFRSSSSSVKLKYFIYVCSFIYIIFQIIELIFWFHIDNAIRYWMRMINTRLSIAVYLILGLIFAYQGNVFLRFKRSYHLSKTTRNALSGVYKVSIWCLLSVTLYLAGSLVNETRVYAPTLLDIIAQDILFDISELTGMYALLWALAPDGQSNQSPGNFICNLILGNSGSQGGATESLASVALIV